MPTAFVCNCDLAASYLIRKLENEGYRVPEDVSVVGFDNFLYPGLCDIGITTYEVDISEMARCPGFPFKQIDKMIGIMNSYLASDFVYGVVGSQKQFFSFFNPLMV